jgi:hypothetical protein
VINVDDAPAGTATFPASRQVENVTVRVLALRGFHCVLHHTATFSLLSSSCDTSGADWGVQHGWGGEAFNVESVKL